MAVAASRLSGMNDQFREQWVARGYCAHGASAAVIPPPAKGLLRLYHIMQANHGISNILYSRMKLAQFRDLNDPFELWCFRTRTLHQRELMRKLNEEVGQLYGV